MGEYWHKSDTPPRWRVRGVRVVPESEAVAVARRAPQIPTDAHANLLEQDVLVEFAQICCCSREALTFELADNVVP